MSRRQGDLALISNLWAEGVSLAGLGGDALAYALAKVAPGRRLLVVVDAEDRAQRLVEGLRFFLPDAGVLAMFPADDHRPYGGFSPDASLGRVRLRTLARLEKGEPILVVASARALMQRVPDAAARAAATQVVVPGQTLERKALVEGLLAVGYLAVSRVDQPGSVALRGDVVDVWPSGAPAPVRLDFFDDEVEQLRRIHPESGKVLKALPRVTLLPAREDRLDEASLARMQSVLGQLMVEQERGPAVRRRVMEDLRAGVRFSALEDYLPALVSVESPLQAFSGLEPVVVLPDDVDAALSDFERMAQQRWEQLDEPERPLVPASMRFESAQAVRDGLAQARRIYGLAAASKAVDMGAVAPEGFQARGAELGPLAAKLRALMEADARVVLVAESAERVSSLGELLQVHALSLNALASPLDAQRGKLSVVEGVLAQGFVAELAGLVYLPVSVIFGAANRHSRAAAERMHHLFQASVQQLSQLKAEDYVVHRLHGIGQYVGLIRMKVGEVVEDYVQLVYRGGDKLMVPATRLDVLSRYAALESDAEVRLDKLGGATWAIRKGKVRDSLLHMARELLELYAKRELATRPPYPARGAVSAAFAAGFPYEETADQRSAIDAVQEDLSRPFPMDRLLCGDVGFGKTEVALRAAARVVESGKQVAFLCPTTVLVLQHAERFSERFAPFGVDVGMLSRFVDPSDERKVMDGLRSGDLKVVVGTTKLLGRDIKFADLGLLVIDEEHRFGVKQKERLKKLRAQVDVLSMSATPIPRTLQQALGGMREMSVMTTPPRDRLSVATSIAEPTRTRVREALIQEMERGGQAFVVHNRIETLKPYVKQLEAWVPEARIAMAHGKMSDDALEQVLVDFVAKKFDVLVCTSIIETGVDMPSVNTLLVDRADLFGLAQLYQLRGRVGRSEVRGRCVLLVPPEITSDARKRLRVLVDHGELGAGFQIASADLELRGGGNLLGDSQAGHVAEVGYDTWVELLEEAVQDARGQRAVEQLDPEIEVPVPAFLPDQLLPDPSERLAWYRRISHAKTATEIERALDALEGEVGVLPVEVRQLGLLHQVRLRSQALGISRVSWLKVRAVLELHPKSPLPAAKLEGAHTRHPKRIQIEAGKDGGTRVMLRFTPTDAEEPLRYVLWALGQLAREP